MDLDTLVGNVKERYSALISKPKMTEKLLAKPPFRFLHDTISEVIRTTGFGEGLYSEAEMDSAQIQDKDAKINYLSKIFNLVGICKGAPLDVKPTKVVAGHEPELTNIFLLSLADCATDQSLDNASGVRRCLDGEEPGSGPIPRRNAAPAESKREMNIPDEKPIFDNKISEVDIAPAAERGKSRGGTRGGKPQQATADIGLSRPAALNFDSEIEKCDGTEATTQAMFASLIEKPKLTEKLLSKPPFRFIFDIIMEVIRVTGFAKGLYTEDECDSSKVSEKQQKIDFLEKIIRVIGVHLNTMVEAKPAKIIAGQEPQATNNMLQLLAVAARLAPDSSAAVRSVLGGAGTGDIGPTSVPPLAISGQQGPPPAEAKVLESSRGDRRSNNSNNNNFNNNNNETKAPEPAEAKFTMHSSRQEDRQPTLDPQEDGEDDPEKKRSARPTTARRRPPKVRDGNEVTPPAGGAKETGPSQGSSGARKTEGIIADGQADDDEDDMVAEEKRLADDIRRGAGGPSSGGESQSKLVQDIRSRQAEHEASKEGTGQSPTAEGGQDPSTEEAKSGEDKGIRLSRLRKTGSDKKMTSASTTGTASPMLSAASPGVAGVSSISAGFNESEVERLRGSIQSLVQFTGPLGTCMDFIQEDLGLMTAELHKWEEDCRRHEALLENEKRKTSDTLMPLQNELAELEEHIADQLARVASTKASIARNDENIQKHLKFIASA